MAQITVGDAKAGGWRQAGAGPPPHETKRRFRALSGQQATACGVL